MNARPFLWLVALATLIAFPAIVLSGAHTAFACSCLYSSTAESIGQADVVFTGSVKSQDSSMERSVWTFNVEGVVQGDIGPTVELAGDGTETSCSTVFGDGTITVFADMTDDGLFSGACHPSPSVGELTTGLATLDVPTIDPAAVGPPVAVIAGPQGPYDLSLLDAEGRAVARAHVGANYRSVAHCPGTTRVALSPRGNLHTVLVVDLATMQVTEERPTDGPGPYLLGDRMACLDGGEQVITAIQEERGTVDVTVNHSVGSARPEVTRRFTDTRRVVFDDAGMVFVLPSAPGGAIRAVSPEDLAAATDDVALPDGASAVDGDISPDGQTLAVLTTSGSATTMEVVTFDLGTGAIDPASVQRVPIRPNDAGTIPASAEPIGFRWVDTDTWLIESGAANDDRYPPSDRYLTRATTDGAESQPINAGNSIGLVTIDGGVLSARRDGVELIDRDGDTTALYPAPKDDTSDSFGIDLAFDDIVDLPAFEPPSPPNALVAIKPVDPNASAVSLGTTEATRRSNRIRWAAGAVGVLAAILIAGTAVRSRRPRSSGR